MTNNDLDEPEYISPYDPEPEVLYTFCNLEYLESTVAGRLWFAPTRTYNDIHENTIFARPIDGDFSDAIHNGEARINEWLDSHVVKCFTKDPTNTLMWAHYADNHKGVCIGFSFDKLKGGPHADNGLGHYPVRYSSTPPLSLISEELTEHTLSLLAFDVLHTKSIHWSYEQEYRFYIRNPEMAGKSGGLIDVGADAVADVIFGAKVKQETIDEMRNKLPTSMKTSVAEIDSRALSYNMVLRPISG